MTNELGTTLADLEEQARRKAEALGALEFIGKNVSPHRKRDTELLIEAAATIRDYIERKV